MLPSFIRRAVWPLMAISLSCACAPPKPSLRTARDEALERDDYAAVLAHEDAILEHAFVSINEMIDLYEGLTERFAKVVEREIAELGPVTDANAEAALARARALIREGERGSDIRKRMLAPVVDGPIRDLEYRAAAQLWRKVEELHRQKQYARAAALGHSILTGLQDPSAFLEAIAVFNRDAAGQHLTVASALPPELSAARALHARIALAFGGVLPESLDAEVKKLVKESKVDWQLSSSGGDCGSFDELFQNHFSTSEGGIPVRVKVEYAQCNVRLDTRTTKETGEYRYEELAKVTRSVPVPKHNCSTSTYTHGYSTQTTRGKYYDTVKSTPITSSSTRCSTTYSYEKEEVEEMVEKIAYETYDAHHVTGHGVARGRVIVAFEGKERAKTFDVAFTTPTFTRYERKHGKSQSLAEDPAQVARDRMYEGVLAAMKTQTDQAVQGLARSRTNPIHGASTPDERDDAWMRAALIRGDVPPDLASSLEQNHGVPFEVAEAGVRGTPLAAVDFAAKDRFKLPPVAPNLIEEARRNAKEDSNTDADKNAMYLAPYGIGGSFSSTDRSPSNLVGLAAHASFNGQLHAAGPLVLGGMFRLGVGADTAATIFTDFDLSLIAGLQIERFSLTPFLGGGLDYVSDSDNPKPNQILLPLAVYGHYGGRVAYAFERVPLTVDLAYSRAGRTSALVPESKRLELRTVLATGDDKYSLVARYAEYFSATSPFASAFSPTNRTTRTYWVVLGKAF